MSLVGMMVVFCCNVLVWMDGVVIGKGARNGGYGERVRDIDGRENNNLISNNRDDNNS